MATTVKAPGTPHIFHWPSSWPLFHLSPRVASWRPPRWHDWRPHLGRWQSPRHQDLNSWFRSPLFLITIKMFKKKKIESWSGQLLVVFSHQLHFSHLLTFATPAAAASAGGKPLPRCPSHPWAAKPPSTSFWPKLFRDKKNIKQISIYGLEMLGFPSDFLIVHKLRLMIPDMITRRVELVLGFKMLQLDDLKTRIQCNICSLTSWWLSPRDGSNVSLFWLHFTCFLLISFLKNQLRQAYSAVSPRPLP